MKSFKLNINGVIIVNYNDSFYKCSIQDIFDEGFSIDLPIYNNEPLILQNNECINMEYYNGAGGYYEFKANVVQRDKNDQIPLYKMSLPMDVKKIQRRNYVRVPITQFIRWKSIEDEDGIWNDAILLDLSGGGIRAQIKSSVKITDKLLIKVKTNNEEIEVLSEVKRCEKVNNSEYICGLEFVDINENKRDKIVREVFLVMRKQREII